MSSVVKSAGVAAACLLMTGCFNSGLTRLPGFESGQPQVEKRSYERHDPFPDELSAPDMQVRPREFSNQRSEPRRALEEKLFQGTTGNDPFQSGSPDLRGSQYRDSVRF
jgi:hypothetical protein